jgi:hypothetical protein
MLPLFGKQLTEKGVNMDNLSPEVDQAQMNRVFIGNNGEILVSGATVRQENEIVKLICAVLDPQFKSYLASFIVEENERGNDTDEDVIQKGIDAFIGGARNG